ncbi:MAG: NusG domain II-containing protein [Clostridiales bacterium]|nr:NusG domain II-containing protein [Clostridiales bacterium]
MKRKDLLILVVVLAIALLCLLSRCLWGKGISPESQPMLRITVGGKLYSEVSLDREGEILIEQEDGRKNRVHFFPGGFEMAQSNCPNQDCLHQGPVTLENMDTRALFHQIICLPNQVVLEMTYGGEGQLLEVVP